MKTPRIASALLLLAGLLLAAGCSSPDSRIKSNQGAFDSWPSDVQAKVKTGQVAVGFNTDMVLMALGEPAGKSLRTTSAGTAEVWTYTESKPHVSIGVGVGSYGGGGTSYSGGAVVGNDGFRNDEKMRVIFDGGRVVAIEERKK